MTRIFEGKRNTKTLLLSLKRHQGRREQVDTMVTEQCLRFEENTQIPQKSKCININYYLILTTWLMEPGDSMQYSQELSENPYPDANQPNSPH